MVLFRGRCEVNITLEEIRVGVIDPIPLERIELVGLKTKAEPILPKVKITRFWRCELAEIWLVLEDKKGVGWSFRFENCVRESELPYFDVSLRPGTSRSSVLEVAMNLMVQRTALLKFEKSDLDGVEVSLSVGEFKTGLTTGLDLLSGFLEQ